MKRFFLALCVWALAAGAAQAQLEKGTWVMGGTVSTGSNKFGDLKTKFTNLTPSVAIMFGSGFSGGINVEYSRVKFGEEDPVNESLIGPFLRYYLIPAGKPVNVFFNVGYGWGRIAATESEGQIGKRGYNLAAGPAIFLNKHSALEIALDYSSIKAKDLDDRSNTFGIKIGFQVYFGGGK